MTQINLQPDSPSTHAIKSLIQTFFDAINAADTVALASHFAPTANVTILRQEPPRAPSPPPPSSEHSSPSSSSSLPSARPAPEAAESLTPVLRTPIESFIALLDAGKKKRAGQPPGTRFPEIFERADLRATRVSVDAWFGSAWSPFEVTFDGVLHHYGVLVFTFGREEEGDGDSNGERWRIEGLTQSYRRTVGWEGEREFV